MFNDLNNQNQGRPAVDDIFAETDKATNNGGAPISEIETHRVGLTASPEIVEEIAEKKGLGKTFKIVLIVIIAAIIISGGYLVYSQFFKSSSTTEQNLNVKATTTKTVKTTTPTAPVEEAPAVTTPTSTPEIPIVLATSTATTTVPVVVLPPTDSDADGLTDEEERLAGTNINIIDTDNDALSDYEEIKIYQTNPLNADTDGDGFLDGAEVKNGYNPNGPGKMPGTIRS